MQVWVGLQLHATILLRWNLWGAFFRARERRQVHSPNIISKTFRLHDSVRQLVRVTNVLCSVIRREYHGPLSSGLLRLTPIYIEISLLHYSVETIRNPSVYQFTPICSMAVFICNDSIDLPGLRLMNRLFSGHIEGPNGQSRRVCARLVKVKETSRRN